jgi:hypothetical protein
MESAILVVGTVSLMAAREPISARGGFVDHGTCANSGTRNGAPGGVGQEMV